MWIVVSEHNPGMLSSWLSSTVQQVLMHKSVLHITATETDDQRRTEEKLNVKNSFDNKLKFAVKIQQ